MSQCPLLHVPLKTTEEVDWIAPLRKYIESVYMDEADKYSEELHTFNRIRQDMRGAGVDNTGRDLLYRYFGQLDLLELRFQVDENNVKINFPWNDAFTQKKISQHSLAYEKACVIFNIAALLSNIASSQNRFEVQGLKTAYHNFQLSAGIFTYINENFLHAPSSDLNREIIKVLIQFMLAQAQECFLEKCITEKKKNTLIAKLASQLNYLYTNIVDALTESLPKKLFPQSMSLLAKTKIKLYSSVAQFNKAKSLEDEGEYGEAVSRFTLAEELAKEAMTCTYNLSRVIGTSNSIFPLDAAKALDVITKRNHDEYLHKMENAVKENDMIYHHPVINHDVLVPIDKLPASKIIPFSQLYNPGDLPRVIGHDLFRKLIPLSVHESASLYSEEMAKLVRLETERIDVADSELEASLSYMSLPDCLTRFKKEDNNLIHTVIIPPEEIIKLNNEIYQKEQNGKSIQSLLSSLPKANKELRQVLEECSSILDMELRNGENLRAKFQDLWTQDPSSTAASGIRQEIRVNRELLEKAIESDNLMFSKFNSNKEDLLIIKSDPSQDRLGQIYAEIITAASTKNSMSGLTESLVDLDKEDFLSNSVTLVYELIDKLKGLKRERKEVLHDLKEQVKNDDISSLLILNKKSVSVEPQLFANELEKYRSHQDRITTTIHHQQTALQEITEHMKKLMDNDESKKINKGWNMIDNVRDNLNLRFKKVADLFYEIHSNSSDGQSFYNDVKPVVHNLLGRVKRFDEERRIERENIQREIEK
ncbi:BRO1-domain-containing protein, partial [Neoconidiobolus thromboides FSU 785]